MGSNHMRCRRSKYFLCLLYSNCCMGTRRRIIGMGRQNMHKEDTPES